MSCSPFTYPALSAYIAVNNAVGAIEFYKNAFGATERFRLADAGTGVVGHAELMLQGCLLMLSEEMAEWSVSPKTLGGTPVKFCLIFDDADVAAERAVKAGATLLMPAADQFYGFRSATVRDPYGHEWSLQHVIEEVSPEEMQRRWDEMSKDGNPS